MTIDEAIKEFTDWAKGNRKEQNYWAAERDENDETNPLSYADCEGLARDAETRAEYHEQLAEWLTDYKELKNSVGAVKLELLKEAQAELEKRGNILHDTIAELEEAKRLLKLAVEDNKRVLRENFGDICQFCKHYSNSEAQCRKPHNGSGSWCCENAEWRYAAEALKLIKS